MNAINILGIGASNRSGVTPEDEQRLQAKVMDMTNADFLIHEPGSDGLSRSIELEEKLKNGLDAKDLTNSETALMVALTAAQSEGVNIDFLSLKNVLDGPAEARDRLAEKLADSHGIILASPVYFGDRSSLVQRFLEMFYQDSDLAALLDGKVFSGVSIGAKRNGGQETLLIYQLLDFLEFNMLGVGNDSRSTAQYGGTCKAGDIGTMLADSYGILTSQGAGRRVASVAGLLASARQCRLRDRLRVGFLILQEYEGAEKRFLQELIEQHQTEMEPHIFEVADSAVQPCLACRYCPVQYGDDEEYRCAIRAENDFFVQNHRQLISMDAFVPVIFSPQNKMSLRSQYQAFIERTRYLRRSDYIFSNIPFMPLVYEEVNANQSLHIRVLTSFIRHETIVHRPIVGLIHQAELINRDFVGRVFSEFVESARQITVGRFVMAADEDRAPIYNPVGYALQYSREMSKKILQQRQTNVIKKGKALQRYLETRVAKK
jgi:multimeric flavodoxin WrbA